MDQRNPHSAHLRYKPPLTFTRFNQNRCLKTQNTLRYLWNSDEAWWSYSISLELLIWHFTLRAVCLIAIKWKLPSHPSGDFGNFSFSIQIRTEGEQIWYYPYYESCKTGPAHPHRCFRLFCLMRSPAQVEVETLFFLASSEVTKLHQPTRAIRVRLN